MTANIIDMQTRSGYGWQKWRQAMAACVGGSLLDERVSTRQSGD